MKTFPEFQGSLTHLLSTSIHNPVVSIKGKFIAAPIQKPRSRAIVLGSTLELAQFWLTALTMVKLFPTENMVSLVKIVRIVYFTLREVFHFKDKLEREREKKRERKRVFVQACFYLTASTY